MRRLGIGLRLVWTTALGACIISTFAGVGSSLNAQMIGAPVPAAQMDSMISTQLGAYTDVQAKRGQQVYAGTCASCHQPTSHQGTAFTQNWDRHPLSDLFTYVSTQMPQDNPGSLDPNAAADVVAFLLKIYAMPAGTTELAPDTVAMKKILIDSRTTRPPQ
jgi:S-disulfanyl-L-cysteine oxidoreductase SoxD